MDRLNLFSATRGDPKVKWEGEGTQFNPYIIKKLTEVSDLFHYMHLPIYMEAMRSMHAVDVVNKLSGEKIQVTFSKIKTTNFITCLILYLNESKPENDSINPEIIKTVDFYKSVVEKMNLNIAVTTNIPSRPSQKKDTLDDATTIK